MLKLDACGLTVKTNNSYLRSDNCSKVEPETVVKLWERLLNMSSNFIVVYGYKSFKVLL